MPETIADIRQEFVDAVQQQTASLYSVLNQRGNAERFDLSALEDKPEQTLHVTFGAAGWLNHELQEHLTIPMLYRVTENDGNALAIDVPELDELVAIQKQVVADFLGEKQAEGWSLTRKVGNTTVIFDEALTDMEHPANHLIDEALLAHPVDTTSVTHTFSINGQGFSCQEDMSVLEECLPNIAEWIESIHDTERSEGEKFAPSIRLDSRLNASVRTGSRQLSIGSQFIRDPAYDKTVQAYILRHESGHAKNAEQEALLRRTGDALSAAFLPHALFETIATNGKEETAAGLLTEYGSADTAIGLIHALSETLDTAEKTFSPMRDHLHNYPWIDSINGMEIAADVDNDTSFSTHMLTAPRMALPEDVSEHLNQFIDVMEEADTDEDLDKNELAEVTTALESLHTRHAPFIADVKQMRDCYQYCSQAREYLADLHAVQSMESPRDSKRYHEVQMEKGVYDGKGEESHPKHQQRLDACGSFAERVLHEREQAKQASQER